MNSSAYDLPACRRALATAMAALVDSAGRHGVTRAVPALDPACARTMPAAGARATIRRELGVDLGFDIVEENFSAMLALALLPAPGGPRERSLIATLADAVRGSRWRHRYRFFATPNGFPADTDCSGLAVAALHERGLLAEPELLAAAGELAGAAAPRVAGGAGGHAGSEAGVLLVYWEDGAEPDVLPRGRKHDAVACANALYPLLLARDRAGSDAIDAATEATLDYVSQHLLSGAYRKGTRYYPSPDAFLVSVSRLCERFEECAKRFGDAVREAILERDAGSAERGHEDDPTHPLNLSQRMIARDAVGLAPRPDLVSSLLDRQLPDGRFPARVYYRTGRFPIYFGSPTITTLFAVAALHRYLSAALPGRDVTSRGAVSSYC